MFTNIGAGAESIIQNMSAEAWSWNFYGGGGADPGLRYPGEEDGAGRRILSILAI